MIDEESFRDDLYYRLNIVPIHVPALRKRREDIPLLVEHFLNHFCQRHRRPTKQIADDAMHVLTAASWPGNVRQLRNVMERLVVTVLDDVNRRGKSAIGSCMPRGRFRFRHARCGR